MNYDPDHTEEQFPPEEQLDRQVSESLGGHENQERGLAQQELEELEQQLRGTLRRRQPSADFAARVVQTADSQAPVVAINHRAQRWTRTRSWMAVAAMLAVTLGIGVTSYLADQRNQQIVSQQGVSQPEISNEAAAEQAARQAELALRITAQHLVSVRQKVMEVSQAETPNQ